MGEIGELSAKVIDEYTFDFGGGKGDGKREDRQGLETLRQERGRREKTEDILRDRRDSRKGKDGKDGKGTNRGTERDERSKGKGKGSNKDGKKDKRVNGEDKKFTDTIPLDIDGFNSGFSFLSRIIGKEGRNVKHIREHTGSSLWLCGRGSDRLEHDTHEESPKPLHVKVTCDEEDGLVRAMKIATDLVESVHDDYGAWLAEKDGGGNGKSDGPRRRPDHDDDDSA